MMLFNLHHSSDVPYGPTSTVAEEVVKTARGSGARHGGELPKAALLLRLTCHTTARLASAQLISLPTS